jgi:hypothetical protein
MEDDRTREIGHGFGLGDEYSLTGATWSPDEMKTANNSNTMPASDALKADATVDVGKLKWNWHRIAVASLIVGPINPKGGNVFEVPVAPKSGFRFKAGNKVLFRQRARLKIFPTDVKTSDDCKVESVSQDGSTVTISRTVGNLDLKDTFPPGSILYAPVPAPANVVPARPYLTLVSPLAERIMAAIGGTMSGKTCSVDEKVYSAPVQAPAVPSQVGDSGPMNALPRIVGAYHGGVEFARGVLHPAGSCQMRNGFDAYTHFCHACQYTLVDQIDPEQHGRVDNDHAKFYTL